MKIPTGTINTIALLSISANWLQSFQKPRVPWDLNGNGDSSLREANIWYRNGNGVAITVPASSLDLDFVDPSKWNVEQTNAVGTFGNSRSGLIYGSVTITYKGNNQFAIATDRYDFIPHKGKSLKTRFRNAATKLGKIWARKGMIYKIHFMGLNTVNYTPFTPVYPRGPKY